MEEKLIELIKNHPFLYNKRDKYYKNVQLREKKFNEFSKLLNVPAKRLKDRWRTLKDKFLRETKNPSARKWKWMDHLYFLRDIKSEHASSIDKYENYDSVFFPSCDDDLEENFEEETCSVRWHDTLTATDDCTEQSENVSETIQNSRLLENISVDGYENDEESSLRSCTSKFRSLTKPATHIFCEFLAKQIDEANLTPYEETSLQIALLKTLREFLPQKK